MLSGHAGNGRTLLLDSLNIWVTNTVMFALWFWALDHGGPPLKGLAPDPSSDFLFAQQQTTFARTQFPNWSPGFVDYLFLAFTTATGIFVHRHTPTYSKGQATYDGGICHFARNHCSCSIARGGSLELSDFRATLSLMGLGCVKTPKLNLQTEISSR